VEYEDESLTTGSISTARSHDCFTCQVIEAIESGEHAKAVARLRTGYVSILGLPYPAGYTIFATKRCVSELHELGKKTRTLHLQEMAHVAEAVYTAFKPVKMNYELLGNSTRHIHWHLIPRQSDEPRLGGPVWEDQQFLDNLHGSRLAPQPEIEKWRMQLLFALQAGGVSVEQDYVQARL
jgi:diadenosine tetraphosphate (Ap4A) HIT family hydrolase